MYLLWHYFTDQRTSSGPLVSVRELRFPGKRRLSSVDPGLFGADFHNSRGLWWCKNQGNLSLWPRLYWGFAIWDCVSDFCGATGPLLSVYPFTKSLFFTLKPSFTASSKKSALRNLGMWLDRSFWVINKCSTRCAKLTWREMWANSYIKKIDFRAMHWAALHSSGESRKLKKKKNIQQSHLIIINNKNIELKS